MDDGGSTQTTIQSNDPWSGVAPHLTRAYGDAGALYDKGPQEYFPGQTYVGADPLEHQANQYRLDFAQNGMQNQIGQVNNAQNSMLNAPDLANNPYVQDLARRTNQRIGQDFQEFAMPAIDQGAQSAGQFGSSRHGIAQAQGLERAARAMGDSTAQLYSNAYGQGLAQQAQGMQFAPQSMNMNFMPADTIGQAGAFLRGEKELALNDDIARYNHDQNKEWTALSKFLGAVGNAPWSSSQTATGQTGSNRLGQVASLGMTGLGLANGFGMIG